MRNTLAGLVTLFSGAAMDAIAASADAFRQRWETVVGREVTVDIGGVKLEIPQDALEPDAFPYPKKLEFRTALKVDTKDSDIEIVSHGAVFRALAQEVQVKIIFEFGSIPEGYALHREKRNEILSQTLDNL